jgi:septal ring factor EnvC (AmiA/AmiB activator)
MRARLRVALLALGFFAASSALALEPSPSSSSTGINDLDRVLERLDADQQKLSAELVSISPKLAIVEQRMIARGRAYYRYARAGLLPAGGGFDSIVDHATRIERARRALERDVVEEGALRKRRVELEAKLAQLNVARAPLDVQREAMQRARSVLREADERRAAFSRAFESSSTRTDHVAIYGADTGPGELDGRSGFRSLKGRLPFPIAGRAEIRRVRRPSASGPGIELVGAPSAPVRSVAAGVVAFVDRYEDYGLTVIVDHGDHYYSIYGQLSAADVHAGEAVASAARIGSMTTQGDKGVIYFELRRNGNTIDPGPWLGLGR